ncbi:hypothetical protein ACQ4LE_000356 [Meloidogyne hapla]
MKIFYVFIFVQNYSLINKAETISIKDCQIKDGECIPKTLFSNCCAKYPKYCCSETITICAGKGSVPKKDQKCCNGKVRKNKPCP